MTCGCRVAGMTGASPVGVTLVVISAAAACSLVLVLSLCLWCFKKNDDDDSDYDDIDAAKSAATPAATVGDARADVKELTKHPWDERSQNKGGLLGSHNIR